MQSIKNTLAKFMANDKFKERFMHLKTNLLENEQIRSFLAKHPEITEEQIEKSLPKLYEFTTQSTNCAGCGTLDQCNNMMQGFQPVLVKARDYIDIKYEPCLLKKQHDERKRQSALIQSLFMPKDVLNASFEKMEEALNDQVEDHRIQAINKAVDFVETFEAGKSAKGLYLYGPFGVGKTYIMGSIANRLAERGVRSLVVYAPEFFREIKNSIQDQTIQEKLNAVKQVPLLIFDDLGAETMTSWTRDEVLGVILQYRMMERLPTLYTSNYDYDELEEHLAYSQKNGLERVKAKRIMERIKHLTDSASVGGKNRRM